MDQAHWQAFCDLSVNMSCAGFAGNDTFKYQQFLREKENYCSYGCIEQLMLPSPLQLSCLSPPNLIYLKTDTKSIE